MTDLSLILFDLNGVLYRYDRGLRIARLSALTGRPAETIETAIWGSGFEDSGDAGTLSADVYLHGFGACIGYPLSEDDWVATLKISVTPIETALALLPRLRPEVQCAVLTNNNLLVKRHFAVLYPEVCRQVGDRAFVSAEFGVRKPDPGVYLRCVARCGVDPTAALFIDDSAANVAGARMAGLQGHEFVGVDGLEGAIVKAGAIFGAAS